MAGSWCLCIDAKCRVTKTTAEIRFPRFPSPSYTNTLHIASNCWPTPEALIVIGLYIFMTNAMFFSSTIWSLRRRITFVACYEPVASDHPGAYSVLHMQSMPIWYPWATQAMQNLISHPTQEAFKVCWPHRSQLAVFEWPDRRIGVALVMFK